MTMTSDSFNQGITRIQAAEALRKSEQRFRALIEHCSDIITVLDADGRIQFESPSVERVLGYKPEELVGKNAFDFVHPDDLAAVREAFREAVDHPSKLPPLQFRYLHKDGSWLLLEGI